MGCSCTSGAPTLGRLSRADFDRCIEKIPQITDDLPSGTEALTESVINLGAGLGVYWSKSRANHAVLVLPRFACVVAAVVTGPTVEHEGQVWKASAQFDLHSCADLGPNTRFQAIVQGGEFSVTSDQAASKVTSIDLKARWKAKPLDDLKDCLVKCAPGCLTCFTDPACWAVCAGACLVTCAL